MDDQTPFAMPPCTGRNILIFSDGTGQAGGLLPDEVRSNVYKLYRSTRCGPDTDIDPDKQLAFYDPGLGSKAAGAEIQGRLDAAAIQLDEQRHWLGHHEKHYRLLRCADLSVATG